MNEIDVLDKAEALFHVTELKSNPRVNPKLSKSIDVAQLGKIKVEESPHIYMLAIKKKSTIEESESESSSSDDSDDSVV